MHIQYCGGVPTDSRWLTPRHVTCPIPAGPARQTRWHRQVAIAVFPRRSADHHGWLLTTADTTQLNSSPYISTGGALTGPLRPGPSGWGAVAAGHHLRRPLSHAWLVDPFLSSADRRQKRQGLHFPPQAGQDVSGHWACTAATTQPLSLPACGGAPTVPAGMTRDLYHVPHM